MSLSTLSGSIGAEISPSTRKQRRRPRLAYDDVPHAGLQHDEADTPSPALIVPGRAMRRPLSGLRGPTSLLILVAWLWTVAHSYGVGAGTKRPYVSLEDILPCPVTGLHNCSTLKHAHTIGPWAHNNHTHNHTRNLGPDECVTAGGLRYLAVVSRHGARYPTKKKMAMARQAASLLCAHPALTPHLQHHHPQALTWCARLLSALEGAVPGGLAALGEDEQQHWGRTLAATYGPLLDHSKQALWRTYVTRKARTKASCDHCTQALRHSLAQTPPLPPTASTTATAQGPQWEAATCALEAEALLRPYVSCARLVQEREQTLAALFDKATVLGVAVSRVQSSLGLPVGEPLVTSEVVLGLYYGCQTDLTLFPSDTALEGGHVGGHSWACGVLGGEVLGELERIEDGENYLTRGFGHSHAREVMAPLLRHLTHSMEQATQDNTPPVVELFFAHDSTLLPLVALLDVLELGTEPLDSRAARYCPFSSRLVLEMWGCGAVVLRYNGLPVRVMEGGLEQWRHDYRHALSVDTHHICRLPSLQEEKEEL